MFLQEPIEDSAVERLFNSDLEQFGYVMNLSRNWAWRPEICEAFAALRTQLTHGSTLSLREQAVLVCATAAGRGNSYCALAWGIRLARLSDPATAAAVLRGDDDGAALTARESTLARWARRVASDPNATRAAQVLALRASGLNDKEIFEATALIAFRIAFSTLSDALGVRPDRQLADRAPMEVRDAVDFGRPWQSVGDASANLLRAPS